jgi:hypothetical protein
MLPLVSMRSQSSKKLFTHLWKTDGRGVFERHLTEKLHSYLSDERGASKGTRATAFLEEGCQNRLCMSPNLPRRLGRRPILNEMDNLSSKEAVLQGFDRSFLKA